MSNEPHKLPLGVGLLAHVDAGKTTLSEALLYLLHGDSRILHNIVQHCRSNQILVI